MPDVPIIGQGGDKAAAETPTNGAKSEEQLRAEQLRSARREHVYSNYAELTDVMTAICRILLAQPAEDLLWANQRMQREVTLTAPAGDTRYIAQVQGLRNDAMVLHQLVKTQRLLRDLASGRVTA